MSETETIAPKPHVLIRDDRGFAKWRPVLTTLSVHSIATDANEKHLVVCEDNEERFRFRLGREDCQHLVRLLADDASASSSPTVAVTAQAEAAA